MEAFKTNLNSLEVSVDRLIQIEDMKKNWPDIPVNSLNNGYLEFSAEYSNPFFRNVYKYRVIYDPKAGVAHVLMISPEIIRSPLTHVNPDGTLCLYDPKDYSVNRRFLLGSHILIWVQQWTFTYEVFLVNGGVWISPEAPH